MTTFEEMLAIDTYATELYNLCFNPFKPYGKDFTTSPYYFKTNNENLIFQLKIKSVNFVASYEYSSISLNMLHSSTMNLHHNS